MWLTLLTEINTFLQKLQKSTVKKAHPVYRKKTIRIILLKLEEEKIEDTKKLNFVLKAFYDKNHFYKKK